MQGELDFSSAGSPPRMREKRPLMALGRELNRITPAYAGKTKSSLLNLVVVQDHPRVCGKNHFKSLISNLVAGSPPRMREKHFRSPIDIERSGITPAYAGKTPLRKRLGISTRDHPRVCGKNVSCTEVELWTVGSPPRMREKPVKHRIRATDIRITPAYAGKTLKDPNEIKTFLSF